MVPNRSAYLNVKTGKSENIWPSQKRKGTTMKKIVKKTFAVVVVGLILELVLSVGVWAEEFGKIPTPTIAPMNPDFYPISG